MSYSRIMWTSPYQEQMALALGSMALVAALEKLVFLAWMGSLVGTTDR